MNTYTIDDINPGQLYSFSEAAKLIPSCRAGKRVHVATLHRWRIAGRLQAVSRQGPSKNLWFLWGSTVLQLLRADQCPEWHGRSPAQRQRDLAAAEAAAEELGLSDPKPPVGRRRKK